MTIDEMRTYLGKFGIKLNASAAKGLVRRLFKEISDYLEDGRLPDYMLNCQTLKQIQEEH